MIRDWLNGKPRDTIAHDNVVSAGAVSNMVNNWRDALAVYDADALRELGIRFRKLAITAPQSAIGFRLASILKDLGVDEENFGDFVSQIYSQCKDIGLKPEYIAYNTKQIVDLSGSIPISEISNYIQEKTSLEERLKDKGLKYFEQKRNLTQKRKTSSSLQKIHSQVLQTVISRLERAFQNYHSDKRRVVGQPNFKRYGRYNSIIYPQFGSFHIKENRLRLAFIDGLIKIRLHRIPIGTIKTCTIIRDIDRWFACFACSDDAADKD